MVHIASARLTPRPVGPTAVKVYTNAKRVMLVLNGIEFGSAKPAGGIATWPSVPLVAGRNELRVRTDTGATDSVTWEGRP